jgi:hypothetical protein
VPAWSVITLPFISPLQLQPVLDYHRCLLKKELLHLEALLSLTFALSLWLFALLYGQLLSVACETTVFEVPLSLSPPSLTSCRSAGDGTPPSGSLSRAWRPTSTSSSPAATIE